jgi:hypothetical protein
VKTLLQKNDQFQMPLSAAERLAKELKPSFVYVLKVNSTLEVTAAYLVHILDRPLEMILKRLRKEDAAGRLPQKKKKIPTSRKKISMRASREGGELAPSGSALKEALAFACGVDLHAYTIRKQEQLTKLGFDERPFESSMTFIDVTSDDIIDAFLGIKKDIKVRNLTTVQNRFGIKLPIHDHSNVDAIISISPSPIEICTITTRSAPFAQPAIFKGKVFAPAIPRLPPERQKIRIDAGDFSLTITRDGLTISGAPSIGRKTPSEWLSYWRMWLAMVSGTGTM